jgi:hypothetical protein
VISNRLAFDRSEQLDCVHGTCGRRPATSTGRQISRRCRVPARPRSSKRRDLPCESRTPQRPRLNGALDCHGTRNPKIGGEVPLIVGHQRKIIAQATALISDSVDLAKSTNRVAVGTSWRSGMAGQHRCTVDASRDWLMFTCEKSHLSSAQNHGDVHTKVVNSVRRLERTGRDPERAWPATPRSVQQNAPLAETQKRRSL